MQSWLKISYYLSIVTLLNTNSFFSFMKPPIFDLSGFDLVEEKGKAQLYVFKDNTSLQVTKEGFLYLYLLPGSKLNLSQSMLVNPSSADFYFATSYGDVHANYAEFNEGFEEIMNGNKITMKRDAYNYFGKNWLSSSIVYEFNLSHFTEFIINGLQIEKQFPNKSFLNFIKGEESLFEQFKKDSLDSSKVQIQIKQKYSENRITRQELNDIVFNSS